MAIRAYDLANLGLQAGEVRGPAIVSDRTPADVFKDIESFPFPDLPYAKADCFRFIQGIGSRACLRVYADGPSHEPVVLGVGGVALSVAADGCFAEWGETATQQSPSASASFSAERFAFDGLAHGFDLTLPNLIKHMRDVATLKSEHLLRGRAQPRLSEAIAYDRVVVSESEKIFARVAAEAVRRPLLEVLSEYPPAILKTFWDLTDYRAGASSQMQNHLVNLHGPPVTVTEIAEVIDRLTEA